jgi:hypothetical protein
MDQGEAVEEIIGAPPPPGTRVWGVRRKAAVVLGIRNGVITREQAYSWYSLSPEELATWEGAYDRGGYKALSLKAQPPRSPNTGMKGTPPL